MCQTCNKACEFPRTSYRLHLNVADSTGSVVVTLFDDIASKLIGKKAAQLLEETEDDGDESVLPGAILGLANTNHIFELKSHTYYDQGSYESFTASNVIGHAEVKNEPLKRPRDEEAEGSNDPAIKLVRVDSAGDDENARAEQSPVCFDGEDANDDGNLFPLTRTTDQFLFGVPVLLHFCSVSSFDAVLLFICQAILGPGFMVFAVYLLFRDLF